MRCARAPPLPTSKHRLPAPAARPPRKALSVQAREAAKLYGAHGPWTGADGGIRGRVDDERLSLRSAGVPAWPALLSILLLASAAAAGPDAGEVHPRLALRGTGRAVHGCARQGLLQSRGPRCHDRHRQRLARVDPARRLRHLRHRRRRRELADPLPRREPDHRPQGGDDGLRPAAVRHRRAQEQGHHADPKSLAGKKFGAPAADGAYAQWPIFKSVNKLDDSDHEVRERRLSRARADAGLGRGRRRVRLLLLGLHEPEVARPAGRRHRH